MWNSSLKQLKITSSTEEFLLVAGHVYLLNSFIPLHFNVTLSRFILSVLFSCLICQCNTESRCLNISWCHGFSGLNNNYTVFTAIDIHLYYVFLFYFKVSLTFQGDPWNCTFSVGGDTCVYVHCFWLLFLFSSVLYLV